MKKETKKKIINTSIITVLSTAALSPVSIALINHSNNDGITSAKPNAGIISTDVNIDAYNYMTLPSNELYNYSPSSSKGIPNGYVTVTNNGGKTISCFNKNNPSVLEWSLNLPSPFNRVASIEYNPYYDSLGVLYYWSADNVIYYGCIDKISSYTGGATISFKKMQKLNIHGNGYWDGATWRLAPVLCTSKKDSGGSSQWFCAFSTAYSFLYNKPSIAILGATDTNQYLLEQRLSILGESPSSGQWYGSSIAGLVSYVYAGRYEITALVKYWSKSWGYNAMKVVRISNGSEKSASENIFKWPDWQNPYAFLNNTQFNASEWGVGGLQYDGKHMTALFTTFTGNSNSDNLPKRRPAVIRAWWNPDVPAPSISFSHDPLWKNWNQGTNSGGWETEIWGGYFDNSRASKLSLNDAGNYSPPMTGVSWYSPISSYFSNGLFAFSIFDYNAAVNERPFYDLTNSTNNKYLKVYKLTTNNSSAHSSSGEAYEYGGGPYVNQTSNLKNYLQGIYGIPILEYNPDFVGANDLTKRNLLVTHNASNKAFLANNQSISRVVASNAYYAYHTTARNNTRTFDLGDPNVGVYSGVDEKYLESLLKLNSSNWTQSPFLTSNLNLQHVKSNSQFRINPSSVKKFTDNTNKTAWVTFDLYSTNVYSSVGRANSCSLDELVKNWPKGNNLIAGITIKGFKWEQKTTAPLQYRLPSNLRASYVVHPSILSPFEAYSWNSENIPSSNNYFKLFVWKAICGYNVERLFSVLRPNPTFTTEEGGAWLNDWKKYVKDFRVTSWDLESGSVMVSITLYKDVIYSAFEGDVVWNIKFSNLRVLGETRLTSNTASTAFSVQNTPLAKLNIPYKSGTFSTYNSSLQGINNYDGSSLVTEGQIRQFIYKTVFEDAYSTANIENGFNPINQWVFSLPFKKKNQYQQPHLGSNFSEWDLLNKYKIAENENDFYFRDWKFYPATGTLSFTIKLRVWNGGASQIGNGNNGLCWSNPAVVEGTTGSQSEVAKEKSATWYITGFRTDNVTTEYDEQNVWNLSGVSNILVSNIYSNSNYHQRVWDALKAEAITNKRIKVPYWVDLNSIASKFYWYSEPENVNVQQGTCELPMRLGGYNWKAQSDGTVIETVEPRARIKLSGFLKISPIMVDSSKMFDISQEYNKALNKIYYLRPNMPSDEFGSWLTEITSRFTQYVVSVDKATNGEGASPLAIWQKRLSYTFKLETSNSTEEYTLGTLSTPLNNKLNSSKGKLNHLYNALMDKGVKIWVKIKDKGVDDNGNPYSSVLQESSTTPNRGNNLTGLVDSAIFISDIDMREWLNNLSTKKGTEAVNANDVSIESLVPPQLPSSSNAAGRGMTFEEVITYLGSIGYKTEFSWYSSSDVLKTQAELPTHFTYNNQKTWMDFKIFYTGTSVPPIYIFGDNTHASKESKAIFSFNLPKKVSLDLSSFSTMISSSEFNQSSTNILINKDGSFNNLIVINKIITAWKNYEESIWKQWTNGMSDLITEYKASFEIKYYINGSSVAYTSSEMWDVIKKGWVDSLNDSTLSKLGLLRFYSEAFKSGTKIQATVQTKQTADPDLKLELLNDKQIVNHGLGTTYDFSNFAQYYQTNKTQVTEGSTADNILGFTLPAYNGVPFSMLKAKLESELGVLFQWSSNKTEWFNEETSIRTVNSSDPAIYLRLSSKTTDQIAWSNEFEIANFSTGTTDTNSSDENIKWSSGIKLPLNLPKFLKIQDAWVQEFINNTKALWSGNTKLMLIDANGMNAQVSALIKRILTENKVTDLTENNFNVEFKINTSDGINGTTFTKFSSTLVDAVSKSDTWNNYANGVYVRIILNGANDGNKYDMIENSYESASQKYALKTFTAQYFENTGIYFDYQQSLNPIKIYIPSSEEEEQKITVQGTDIFNVNYSYPTPMYFDEVDQKVYTDKTKRKIVQFSTKLLENSNVGYNDPNAEWSFIPPRELTIDKNLFVRVIINPEYTNFVYGPEIEKTAKAWKIDTTAIKPIISANISSLKSIIIKGILNVASTNIFNLEEIKASELAAINEAISEQTGRTKVAVVYNLRISSNDTNNDWISIENLIAKLQKEVQNYSSVNYGIASFISNQFVLRASLVSTDPEYQIKDSVTNDFELVKTGVVLNTDNIVTNVDISNWVNFLKVNKTIVVERVRFFSASFRSNVSLTNSYLQPPKMTGDISSGFLAGRTFNDIFKKLKVEFGVNFEFSTDKSTWVDNIESLQSFDDTVNKVYVKIKQSTSAPQINVIYESNSISTLEFEMNIQYPKTLTIDQAWINDFIASTPVTGNTKYLQINSASEKTLIDKIVAANPPVGSDPAPKVWVEYRIGAGQWFNREAFIAYLKSQVVDQTTNLIQMKLVVDPVNENEPLYNITDKVTTISEHDISLSTKIKIYVNNNYELSAEKIEVIGTISISGNTKLTYVYNDLPISSAGQWTGNKGLKVQWTLSDAALYSDPVDSPLWLNSQPIAIDPVKRYLALRIIEENGYQYSASYTNDAEGINPSAKIHVFDTSKIFSEILVDLSKLKDNLVLQGESNNLDLQALKNSEKQVLSFEGGDKLEVKYKVTLSDGSQLSDVWMTSDELQNKLLEYSKNYNNASQGLIKFSTNNFTTGATIEATYVVKKEFENNYKPYDSINNVDKGISTDVSKIVTKVDLSKYFAVLKSTAVDVVLTNNALSITPPGMTGAKGSAFLAGLSYNEIVALLSNIGIKTEFKANDKNNNEWVPLTSITELNNANELFARFTTNDASLDSTVSISGLLGQQDNRTPEEVKLLVNLPMRIVVNLDDLKQLAFEGTTINISNIATLKEKEAALIQQTKNANKTGDAETDAKVDYIKLEVLYSLDEKVIDPSATGDKQIWMTLSEIDAALKTSKVNFGTNRVLAKFNIANNKPFENDPNTMQYKLSNEKSIEINPLNLSHDALFKSYVHSQTEITSQHIFDLLKVIGDQDNYQIENLDTWKQLIPKGLLLEFNSVVDGNNGPDSTKWSSTFNSNPISETRQYWIRFVVQPGFVFENASPSDPTVSEPILLDTSKIASRITVDLALLKEKLVFNGQSNDLDLIALKNSEKEVLSIQNGDKLEVKYKVTLNDRTQLSQTWMSADELQAALLKYSQNYNNASQGLIKFKTDVFNGATIEATYVAKPEFQDQYKPSDNVNDVNKGISTNTNNLVTVVDLSEYFKVLSSKPSSVTLSTDAIASITPPAMTGTKGSTFLAGLSYNEIIDILKVMGIKPEFKASGINGDQWVELSQITQLNNANELFVRFTTIDPQLDSTVKILGTNKVEQNNQAAEEVKLVINLPIKIVVDVNELKQLAFEGTTIDITNIADLKTKEAALIQQIKTANKTNNQETNDKIDAADIVVLYSLNEMPINSLAAPDKQVWMTLDVIQSILSTLKTNFDTNRVLAKFVIANNTNYEGDPNTLKYKLSDENSIEINPLNLTNEAKFKVYIHNVDQTNPDWIFKNLKINGNQEKYEITNYDSWFKNIPNGLIAEFNVTPTADGQPDPNSWTTIYNEKPISETRQYWVRFKVKPGFVFENASQSDQTVSEPILLDTSKITSKITVDLAVLKEKLVFNGQSNNINLVDLKASEQEVLNIQNGDKLEVKYKVTLNDGTQLSQTWMSADELQAALNGYSLDYNNSTQGLIKFNTDAFKGATIEATYVVKLEFQDQYVASDAINDVNKGISTNTNSLITTIDLSEYFNILSTKPVQTVLGNNETITSITPPAMPGEKGSAFLVGLSYNEIIDILKVMGVKPEFKANGMNNDQWVELSQITQLNNANELFVRFTTIDSQLDSTVKILGTNKVEQNNQIAEEVKLVVNLPLTIVVDVNQLKQLAFEGTTIDITNIADLRITEADIIKAIKDSNKTNDPQTNEKIDAAKIEVLYSLDKQKVDLYETDEEKATWLTLDAMYAALKASNINFGTNRVYAKFVISNNSPYEDDPNTLKYKLSNDSDVIINEEELKLDAKFKVYVHNVQSTTPEWIINNLILRGNQENYKIDNYDSWLTDIPKGLVAQFNALYDEKDEPVESGWSTIYNQNQIGAKRNYWVRFAIQPGFVFENPSLANDRLTDPVKLNLNNIQVALKLESAWLNKIVLTGNTKNLQIDESQVIQTLRDTDNLPIENLVQIEYTIDGASWFKKDKFIEELVRLDGAVNENKWIILLEDIKARFVINHELNATLNPPYDPPYGIVVDGIVVPESDDSLSTAVQLITSTQNTEVKGYINANKLTSFVASNFFVSGTNSKAILNIKDVNKFNQMLQIYSSANIFTILYASQENAFIDTHKIWIPGQDLKQKIELDGDFASRYIALKLKSINEKYIVYHDDVVQNDGYVISSPEISVYISVSITNPLLNKKVVIRYKEKQADGSYKPIYYQNNGAFVVYIQDINGTTQEMTFSEFINSLPTGPNTDLGEYTTEMKNALEIAYYVSPNSLNDEEYAAAVSKDKITDYASGKTGEKYGVWKSYPATSDFKSLDFGLLVNDYVILALRVKEEFISSESNLNGYVIKDDNHNPTLESRVSGYMVHADKVNVDWSSLVLKNVGKAETATYGLDGYAVMQNVSLSKDLEKNYEGVSLKLNLFDEFYKGKNGNILVSGSGDRLVKRDTTNGINTGKNYKDIDGRDLVDANGQTVAIYETANGLPCAPIALDTPTRSKDLIESINYVFGLELSSSDVVAEYSLFKFQKIQIEFGNKKGLSDVNDPNEFDYYVDQVVTRDYIIDSEIKLPIPNDTNIEYKFNSEEFQEFIKQNILESFVNSIDPDLGPINGQSKLVHMFEMTRTENGQPSSTFTTIQDIKNQIEQDFGKKVVLKITYTSHTGQVQFVENLSDIKNLSNGDKFKVEIVSADENNYIYAQQPDPLLFTITGLREKGLDDLSLLQYLRVKQIGDFNGEGKFGIFINDPNTGDASIDFETYLSGFTFQIRVWDKEKQIKHNWTSDIDNVNNLENGDWVEWKLVSMKGVDVETPFYNTIANQNKHNANNNQYVFEQVLKSGKNNNDINSPINGIGEIPEDTKVYPGDRAVQSGFVIADLKEKSLDDEFTTITEAEFIRLMESMNFKYSGVNGHGNMYTNEDIKKFNVNTVTLSRAVSRASFTLDYLIEKGYITFYYNNSSITGMNEFKWTQVMDGKGNIISSPGILSNGDKIQIRYKDNQTPNAYVWNAPDVSGLDEKADSMSTILWVGIGAATIASFGIFALIYFAARNRKLKSEK